MLELVLKNIPGGNDIIDIILSKPYSYLWSNLNSEFKFHDEISHEIVIAITVYY